MFGTSARIHRPRWGTAGPHAPAGERGRFGASRSGRRASIARVASRSRSQASQDEPADLAAAAAALAVGGRQPEELRRQLESSFALPMGRIGAALPRNAGDELLPAIGALMPGGTLASAASLPAHHLITRQIQDSRSWLQVAELLARYTTHLNHINVAAMFTRLARVVSIQEMQEGELQEFSLFLDELADTACGHMPSFSAGQLSSIMWSLAKLCVDGSSSHFMTLLLEATANLMPWCDAGQELTNMVWACAVTGAQPSRRWGRAWLGQTLLRMPALEPRHQSQMLWALAKLDMQPSGEWMAAFWARACVTLAAGNTAAVWNSQDASNTLWAAASLRQPPPHALTEGLVAALTEQVQSASVSAVSMTLWALATLSYVPTAAMADCMYSHLLARAEQLEPQSASSTMWALAKLGQRPPPALLAALLAAAQRCIADCEPRQLSNMAWACAVAGWRPGQHWWQAFMGALQQQLPNTHMHAVSKSLCALAKAEVAVSQELLEACIAASQQQLRWCSGQSLSSCLWALAKLGLRDTTLAAPLVEELVARAGRALAASGSIQPASTGSIDSGYLADDEDAFEGEWDQGQWERSSGGAALEELSDGARRHQRAGVGAEEDLGSSSGDGGGMAGAAQQLAPGEFATALYALAKLKCSLRPEQLDSCLAYAQGHMRSFSAQELSNLLWALVGLRCPPPSEAFAAAWLSASWERMEAFNGKDLSQSLWALAQLGAQVPGPWLQRYLQEATATMRLCGPQDLANMAWGLARLGLRLGGTQRGASRRLAVAAAAAAGSLDSADNDAPAAAGSIAPPSGGVPPVAAAWTAAFLAQLEKRLDACGPQHLSTTLWALAKLGIHPSASLMDRVEHVSFAKLPMFKPQELAATIWAFSLMRHVPQEGWLDDFMQQSCLQAGDFSSQEYANVLGALARVSRHGYSAEEYAEELLGSLEPQLPRMGRGAVAMVLWSAAAMELAVPPQFVRSCLARLAGDIGACSAQELSGVLWACVRLNHRPSPEWVATFEAAMVDRLALLHPSLLACYMWALSELRARLSPGMMRVAVAALDAKLESFSAKHLTMMARALAKMKQPLPPALLERLSAALELRGGNGGGRQALSHKASRATSMSQAALRNLHKLSAKAAAKASSTPQPQGFGSGGTTKGGSAPKQSRQMTAPA